MSLQPGTSGILIFSAFWSASFAQDSTQISLNVKKGVPLRVIATEKIRFKKDQPVHGRLVEPVFAFDREVIPQGSEVTGRIKDLHPVSRRRRVNAFMSGDLTPLRDPDIEFDTLIAKDGRRIPLQTQVTPGSSATIRFATNAKKKGRIAGTKQAVRDQIESRKVEVITAVKTPGKLQRLSDNLLARLPYHPQYWPNGTRLNAELLAPLDFGMAAIPVTELSQLGAEPTGDLVVHARLVTDLDSRSDAKGMAVEALLTQPLFSADHHLLFPEGSRLRGSVVQVRPARSWHRNGQLRFSFQNFEPEMSGAAPVQTARRVEGQLDGVEVGAKEKVTIDSEGGAKVTSSNTRFIAPAVKLLMASAGLDRDRAEVNGVPTGGLQSNAGGQAVAGAAGFGLIGAGLGQISRPVSAAIGFYGAAVSLYTNLIGPGQNLKFPVQTPIEVRFASRVAPPKE